MLQEIFVCHAIPNHWGGAWDIVKLHDKLNKPRPRINKKLMNNPYEKLLLSKFPDMDEYIQNISDG